MRIIPAIDIIDGKCVRLTKGDYSQKKIYNENPLEVAKQFEAAGISFLHLVDLDGAKAGKVINWESIKTITSQTSLKVDFGGGVKTRSELEKLFDLGVNQVNIGSLAVKNKSLVYEWINHFGSEKIILSADVQNEEIQINGWQDNASLTIHDFAEDYKKNGIKYIACTDISTDGMLAGPNFKLYQKLMNDFPTINWIASGGVSCLEDVKMLKTSGLSGVIIGKAIYEGLIRLTDLNKI